MIPTKEFMEALHFVFSLQFLRMAVLWTLSLIIFYFRLFIQLFPFSRKSKSYRRCNPANGSTFKPLCIITGATSGLGKAAAYALSNEGFYVVLAGRSSHSLSMTMKEIKEKNKNAHLKGFQVDISSFHSILKFKDSLEQWLSDSNMHSSIQLLINNAGILATCSRLTAEGYDQMMATNYMGAFSLTKLLLPLLKSSPIPSRIVNVSSFTHLNVFDAQVDEDAITGKCFSRPKLYPCSHIYEYSKLCLLLFSYELHRQLGCMHNSRHISVNAVDPGAVETNIMREVPSCISRMAFMVLKLLFLLQSPENGVNAILDAALAPPEVSGVYFFGGKGRTVKSSELSYNMKLAEKLWTTSCDLFLMCLASEQASSSSLSNTVS